MPDTTTRAAAVLRVLQSETAQRLHGLYVSSIMTATGLSESAVRSTLDTLVEQRLVKRAYHRSSRGYNYVAVSQAERDEDAAKQALVDGLERALGTLTGRATAVTVNGLITGGISIRLSQSAAQALLDAIHPADSFSSTS